MNRFVKRFNRKLPSVFPISMGQTISLGDYGTMNSDGYFIKEGNITQDFGITFQTIEELYPTPHKCQVLYGSETSFSTNAEGAAGDLFNADLTVNFTKKESFYYQSTFIKLIYINAARITLEIPIMDLYTSHRWKTKYVIITSIYMSKNMLLVQAGEADQEVIFTCESDTPIQAFEDIKARANINYKSKKSSIENFSIDGDNEMGIAFGLHVLSGWWSKSIERYSSATDETPGDVYEISYQDYIEDDNNPYDEDIKYEFINIK